MYLLFKHSADLLMKLTEGTGPDGTVAQIGQIVIDWVGVEDYLTHISIKCFKNFSNAKRCNFCHMFSAAWSERLQRLL